MNAVGAVEKATQDRVLALLTGELGYRQLGNLAKQENSNVRTSDLEKYLRSAGYPEDLIGRAVGVLDKTVNDQSKSLYERNRDVYGLLRYGVQVKPERGAVKQTVWLVDWGNPEANDWAVAEEVTVVPKKAGGNPKRPDVVVYLNGIAVLVLELKRSTVSIGEGIRQTLDNQSATFIEEFFATVAWVMAGNDTQGLRYATINTPAKHWLEWKEEGQLPPAEMPNPLDAGLRWVLPRRRFLELLHDFVIYDLGVKKLPRHHQYFGVKAAQQRVRDGGSGIIWHTQGSGKSLTMVWLARWIKEHLPDARVLIITDRDELDSQIAGVFAGVGEQIYRTTSGQRLLDSIAAQLPGKDGPAPAITCSLIHKFGSGAHDPDSQAEGLTRQMIEQAAAELQPKGAFYVFVDEAHRTQSGILHDAMRTLLPGAVFVGFTGTPLLARDKKRSVETFGPFIHVYRYDQAVGDGVVLDLKYEARSVEQRLGDQDKIDQWFDSKTTGLNDVARSKLKQKWGSLQAVFSSKGRLQAIVADIVFDFETKPRLSSGRGNALLAAGSVYEACRYYELFAGTDLAGKVAIITSYEPTAAAIKGAEVGEGQTEALLKYDVYRRMLADWFGTDPDSAAGRVEEFERQVKEKFVHQPGQMRLLIVVDKLLTGFDAPPATYLYIDKSMQDHGLFQAICRVNRLDASSDPGSADGDAAALKDHGHIVDYKDLFLSLTAAVTDYTGGAFEGYDDADVAGMLVDRIAAARDRFDQARDQVAALCEPVAPPRGSAQFRGYFCPAEGMDADAVAGKEKLRLSLYRAVGALTRAWAELAADAAAAGLTGADVDRYSAEVAHYNAVKQELLLASGDGIDLKAYEPGMRALIDMYVKADGAQQLSDLDNQSFLNLLAARPGDAVADLPPGLQSESSAAEVIEANVRRVIVDANPTNPKYFNRMSELLEEVIAKHRDKILTYQQYLQEVSALARQVLDPAASHHYPAHLTSPIERVLYDSLDGDEAAAAAVHAAYIRSAQEGWTSHTLKRKKLTGAVRATLAGRGVGDPGTVTLVMDALAAHAG